jgi:hypothetical protein
MGRVMTEREREASEWPKHCQCGQVYSPSAWQDLPYAYEMTDAFGVHEARHCVCNSTLLVLLKVLNLAEE